MISLGQVSLGPLPLIFALQHGFRNPTLGRAVLVKFNLLIVVIDIFINEHSLLLQALLFLDMVAVGRV